MKDFESFLLETREQRGVLLERITQEMKEISSIDEVSTDTSLCAALTLSLFRGEMAIYHAWMREQFPILPPSTDAPLIENASFIAKQR